MNHVPKELTALSMFLVLMDMSYGTLKRSSILKGNIAIAGKNEF